MAKGKAGTGLCCGASATGETRLIFLFLSLGVLLILVIEVLNLGVIVFYGGESLALMSFNSYSAGKPEVKGTRLRGAAAVAQYKQRVACFSESGRWVYDDTPRWITPNIVGDFNVAKCDGRWLNSTPGGVVGEEANRVAANGSNWNVRTDLKWRWETNESCPLLAFDREDLCRVMGGIGNLLIVGDSLNQEILYIFLNHLLVNTTGMRLPLVNWKTFHIRFKVCEDVLGEGGLYIGFVRNDRLSLTHKWEKCMRESSGFQEYPWISYLAEWNISALILNRGAHYETNGNYTEHLINTLHVIQARYPDTAVFYRSTQHGHPNCTSYDGPLTRPLPPESMPYNWARFAEQNALAQQITERFGHTFLDMAAILNSRPDGHLGGPDCLHYCLPGPFDVFLPVFYNVLRLLP